MGTIRNAIQLETIIVVKQHVHLEILNEGHTSFNVLIGIDIPRQEPPEAPNEVSDHKNDNNQPKDLVGIHDDVETLKPISPSGILIVTLDDPLEPTGVQDGHQLGETHQSDHPSVLTLSTEDNVEGEGGHEVQKHPPTFEVPDGDLLVVSNFLESLFVLVFTHKVEEKVKGKKYRYKVVNIVQDV